MRIYRHYLVNKLKLGYRTNFASRASPLRIDLDSINDFFAPDYWLEGRILRFIAGIG